MSGLKVLITGTNKGIGYDLVKVFLKKQPEATIFATSRDGEEKASLRWKDIDSKNAVQCRELEVGSTESIKNLAESLKNSKEKLDIIINNAGVGNGTNIKDFFDKPADPEYAKHMIHINTMAVIEVTKALLPFLSDEGRVVNVSSTIAGLNNYPQQTKLRYNNPNIREEDIMEGAREFLEQTVRGQVKNWNYHSYSTSKMFINAWSRFILQKKWMKKFQTAICVSPGFCITPMTSHGGFKPAHAYSSHSGAVRIYQSAVEKGLNPEIFYHRGRQSNFMQCGSELPFDEENLQNF